MKNHFFKSKKISSSFFLIKRGSQKMSVSSKKSLKRAIRLSEKSIKKSEKSIKKEKKRITSLRKALKAKKTSKKEKQVKALKKVENRKLLWSMVVTPVKAATKEKKAATKE
jgi:hypothetical protein